MFSKIKSFFKRILPLPANSMNKRLDQIEQNMQHQIKMLANHQNAQTGVFLNAALLQRNFDLMLYIVGEMPHFTIPAPKVSVIMPVFNAEQYLPECLDSLRIQTLWNFEVLCIDDGSDDGSYRILKNYATMDFRFRVFQQEHSNAGHARNLGMQHAKGEYLMFLDADDFFEPRLLASLYEKCKQHDADMCLCGGDQFDEQIKRHRPISWYLKIPLLPQAQPFNWHDCPEKFFQIITPAPWSKMFKRKSVEEWGLLFQEFPRANDLFFVYSAYALSDKIAYCDDILVHYRVGMVNNLQANNHLTPLIFMDALCALKGTLMRAGIYEDLEQSFLNMVVVVTEYNIRTQKNEEGKQCIIDALRCKYIDYFGLQTKESAYYTELLHYHNLLGYLNLTGSFNEETIKNA